MKNTYLTLFLTIATLQCNKPITSNKFELVGFIKTDFEGRPCSKMVLSSNTKSIFEQQIKYLDIISPNFKKHEIEKIAFNDATYYYLANGRIKQFVTNTLAVDLNNVHGYFIFCKGLNDTIFLYRSIGKPKTALEEVNFTKPSKQKGPNEFKKEVSIDEWISIRNKINEECFDTMYGIKD